MMTATCIEKYCDNRSSGRKQVALEKLRPAEQNVVALFKPYFQGKKRDFLPLAISLYRQGSLEGERQILGSENIPFVASWSIDDCFIPAALTRCRVQFNSNPDLSYELQIANHQLVNYLIEVIVNYKVNKGVDFSKSFYYKLLQMDKQS